MSQSTVKRPIITHENPKSPISEAYRTLRTNIDFSSIDDQLQVLMLTSAGPGEGKSTTAANLAVAYSQSEKKVVLLDADLRKPTMHHTFQRSNRQGLTNILAGQSDWQDVITATDVDRLEIIPSGPIPPNPSEMLSSNRMTMLLNSLKENYDVIIIDTPPALAVTDAQVVATKCDGVILVIDSGSVKKRSSAESKSESRACQSTNSRCRSQ